MSIRSLPRLVSPPFAQPTAGVGPELQLYAALLFMLSVVSNWVVRPGLSDGLIVYCNESWITVPPSLVCHCAAVTQLRADVLDRLWANVVKAQNTSRNS